MMTDVGGRFFIDLWDEASAVGVASSHSGDFQMAPSSKKAAKMSNKPKDDS